MNAQAHRYRLWRTWGPHSMAGRINHAAGAPSSRTCQVCLGPLGVLEEYVREGIHGHERCVKNLDPIGAVHA